MHEKCINIYWNVYSSHVFDFCIVEFSILLIYCTFSWEPGGETMCIIQFFNIYERNGRLWENGSCLYIIFKQQHDINKNIQHCVLCSLLNGGIFRVFFFFFSENSVTFWILNWIFFSKSINNFSYLLSSNPLDLHHCCPDNLPHHHMYNLCVYIHRYGIETGVLYSVVGLLEKQKK